MKLLLPMTALVVAACQPRENIAAPDPAATVLPAAVSPAQVRKLDARWTRLGYPATRECGIVGSSDWSAQLVTAPGAPPRLIISGAVSTKPTTSLTLRLDPRVMESYPVQRIAFVDAAMPSEPTPDVAEARMLRGEWPIDASPFVLSVRCGRTILVTIRDGALPR